MVSDLDIYRSASVLMRQHGEEAPIFAAIRADAMLEADDLDGCDVWKRIVNVTFQLAEVAVPKELFRKILSLIDDLRRRPTPA